VTPHARLPIPGTYNFRDVGGLVTSTGTVRPGVLYRSDGLHRLGERGRAALADLGIGIVIDLRDENEIAVMPDDLGELEVEVLHLPVFEGSGAAQGPNVALDTLYQRIIEQHSGVVVSAIREIASAGDRAVVVHCTAGKDRTGIVTALTLLAIGVERDDVVADYARTEGNLAGEWLEEMVMLMGRYGVPDRPELRVLMGGSPPEVLERIIVTIERDHGSAREYLLAAGLTLDELAALERLLVEPR
jgi:protein-tyrosine phosphatase